MGNRTAIVRFVVIVALTVLAASCAPMGPMLVADPSAADLERAAHPPSIGTIHTESYGPDPMHVLQILTPEGGPTSEAMILYVHGGGWGGGTSDGVLTQVVRQSSRGYLVASIEYRLTPSVYFPDNLTDVKRAIRWAKANAARLGVRSDRIVLAGFSAGAHLALMAGETVGQYEPGDLPPEQAAVDSRPAAVFASSAPTDLEAFMTDTDGNPRFWAHSMVGQLLGCTNELGQFDGAFCTTEQLREASPRFRITSGQPDVYLVHGTADTIVDTSQNGLPFAEPYASFNDRVWYDLVEGADHAAGEYLNAGAFDAFLDTQTHTSPPPYPSTSSTSSSSTSVSTTSSVAGGGAMVEQGPGPKPAKPSTGSRWGMDADTLSKL